MPVTTWQFPGTMIGNRTISGSDADWTNPDNAKVDDLNDASVSLSTSQQSSGLAASNFDFSEILPGAIITGIEIRVGDFEHTSAGPRAWAVVRLILADGSDGTENKAVQLQLVGGADQTDEAGHSSDAWGETLTLDDVNDADFGFFVGVDTGGTALDTDVNFMQMRIHYTGTEVTQWKFPGTTIGNRAISGSSVNWANPNDAQADDGATADAGPLASTEYSAGLTGTNYSWADDIPAGARIDGIEIRVGDYILDTSPGSCRNLHLIFPLNATGVQNRNTDLPDFTTSLQTNEVGGAQDLWGETTISWDDVHLLNFGFYIGVESAAAGTDFEIDFLQMRIYFTEAQNTGWQFPDSAAGARGITGGDFNWSNPNFIKLDDNNAATCLTTTGPEESNGLAANNFDFSAIPVGATISGVEIRIDKFVESTGDMVWDVLRLIDSDNSDAADNRNSELAVPSGVNQTNEVGGWNEHWGQGFTRADVQDADFGFFVGVSTADTTAGLIVNNMQMRVFYHTTQTPLPFLLASEAGNYGNKGPFLIGDWIYALTSLTAPLRMQMQRAPATDPGFGFVILDAANEPTNTTTTSWSAIPFGNTIHILNGAFGDVTEMEFDTATQTWIDSGTLIVDAGTDTAHRSMIDLQVRTDGELIATYNGEIERVHGGDKERVYVMHKTGSPLTWTINVALDVGGDIHYGDAILTKSPNTNGMHCFWQRQTNTADPPTTWLDAQARTFLSDNTLATLATGSADTNEAMLGAVQGVSWDNTEDSPDDQMTIWMAAQLNASTSCTVRFLGSQNNIDVITGIGSSTGDFNEPFVHATVLHPAIAIDTWPNLEGTSEDIYALWSGGGTQGGDEDLYFSASFDNGVTWTTPEELINNFTITEITGSIFQRGFDVVFAYVYDQNDEQFYGEKILRRLHKNAALLEPAPKIGMRYY